MLDQICLHTSTGKAAVGQQVGSCGLEVVSGLGQQVTGVVQEAVELGLDGCCVGLVVDRVEHGLDSGPRTLGNHCHQVRGDSLNQARAGVRGDKLYPSKSPATRSASSPFQAAELSVMATRSPKTS